MKAQIDLYFSGRSAEQLGEFNVNIDNGLETRNAALEAWYDTFDQYDGDPGDGSDGGDVDSEDLNTELDPSTTEATVGKRISFQVLDTTGNET